MADVTEPTEPTETPIGPGVGQRGGVRLESPTDSTAQIEAVLNPAATENVPTDVVVPDPVVPDPGEPTVAEPDTKPEAPSARMLKRIDALTARNYQYAQRIAELEAAQTAPVAAGLTTPPDSTQAQPEPSQPLMDNFDTSDAYIQASAKWQAEQVVAANNVERDAAVAAQRDAATNRDAEATWTVKIDEVRAAHADYVDVLSAAQNEPMGPQFKAMLVTFPQGGEMLYQIAKHPGESTRLNALSDVDRMRELVVLESTLTSPAADPDAAPVVPAVPGATPQTPAPLAPVVPVVAATETMHPSQMNFTQYKKYRARMLR